MDNMVTKNENANEKKISNSNPDHEAETEGKNTEMMASYVGHKAEDAALYVGHKAEDTAAYVGHKADDAIGTVGSGLRSLGDSVQSHGPDKGMAGDASTAVADGLENTGLYLQEETLQDMAKDLTNMIRRNPIPAMLIGIATGYLVGKALAPRS